MLKLKLWFRIPKKQKYIIQQLHRWTLSNTNRTVKTYISETIPKTCKARNTPKFILLGHHHLIPNQAKISKRKMLHSNITDERRCKNLQQTKFSNTLKGSFTITNWDLSQGCKDFSISTNQSVWYTTLTNWRIKMIWSFQEIQEKLLTKFNTHLRGKLSRKWP